MNLSILLSILTATYSLISTTSVEQTGIAPYNSIHTFERTANSGQRGQMTAGNSTTLTLEGWDGHIIRSILLEMHSNSKSGAGSLVVQIGNQLPWTINDQSFADPEWAGEYSTRWITIQKDMLLEVNSGDLIEIKISATENSLYIKSYVIIYESTNPIFYTVDFSTGLDTYPEPITQNKIAEPIILPEWKDTLDWYFLGWSNQEIMKQNIAPTIYKPGEEYTPISNCTLWAVYTDHEKLVSDKSCLSGKYTLAMRNELTEFIGGSGMAMNGNIDNGTIPLTYVELNKTETKEYAMNIFPNSNMIYDIVFNEDSTLTIAHTLFGDYIGYKEDKLSATLSKWNYRIINDGSIIIYYTYDGKDYALYFGLNSSKIVAYSQHMNIDSWQTDALWLFPINVSTYTSQPLTLPSQLDVIESQDHQHKELLLNIGTYKLYIRDGKKYIQIK